MQTSNNVLFEDFLAAIRSELTASNFLDDRRGLYESVEKLTNRVDFILGSKSRALHPEELDVDKFVAYLGEMYRQNKRVQFDNTACSDFYTDVNLLMVIVSEAVDNALRFSDDDVSVSIDVDSDELVIDVHDQGKGPQEDVMASAGKPFILSENDSSSHGLGMSMILRGANRLQADVSFLREASGFVVRFRVPNLEFVQNTDVCAD